jgi:CHASE2 domain-containing sensor protein
VQFKRPKRAPVVLALIVLALVCGVRLGHPDFADRLERMTYDLRVRAAQKFPAAAATNLAFVAMEDSSIAAIRRGLLGQPYGLYWPRHVYGRLVEELSAQGAKTIAFDVLFGELRPDHAPVQMADGGTIESDDFFALQMRRAGNVISAFTAEVTPPDLFTTNSLALGDISTEKDSDGVLRRIKSFNLKWHPAFKSAARQLGINLENARIEPDKILLPQSDGTNIVTVALDHDGNFDLTDFVGDEIPKGFKRYDKPFTRVWDLGIVMAAQELKLDLDRAEVDLPGGKIILRGANGVERTIPIDAKGYFYINWQLTAASANITRAKIEDVLAQDKLRLLGETNGLRDDFRGKLVVIGSEATGNDLSDHGATPLENDTPLVSKHWNVANSIITGQFIRRAPLPLELALILLLGALTALLTWELRAVAGSLSVVLLMAAYFGATVFLSSFAGGCRWFIRLSAQCWCCTACCWFIAWFLRNTTSGASNPFFPSSSRRTSSTNCCRPNNFRLAARTVRSRCFLPTCAASPRSLTRCKNRSPTTSATTKWSRRWLKNISRNPRAKHWRSSTFTWPPSPRR